MLAVEALQERVANSELGQEWIDDPLMNKDIWALTELGYGEEECTIRSDLNIHFKGFSLLWLKLLAKLTVKASVRKQYSFTSLQKYSHILCQLDRFLIEQYFTQPQDLTNTVLQKFISEGDWQNRRSVIAYVTKLWAEEEWLKVQFIPPRIQYKSHKIEVIPEEVLHQVYENLDLFPPMLERLFRLQLVLGSRIGEMLTMPRHCLKQEGEQLFLLRWIEKRKQWRFIRIHLQVAELVQQQQRFLDSHLDFDSDFDKLFCWLSTARRYGAKNKIRDTTNSWFEIEPVYQPRCLNVLLICKWLRNFSEVADLRDKYGNRFQLTSHMFRRTKASIMAHCETEDEYIATVLGHGSLDMLPHYRKRSLERLERESQTKGYADMYGRVTTFKPRQKRYERLADLLKVTTSLGECHRPTMLGDCQYRYACLSCDHHRVTLEDRPRLEADRELLQQDLQQAQTKGQQRRVTEIQRLLQLINKRLQGLAELETILERD